MKITEKMRETEYKGGIRCTCGWGIKAPTPERASYCPLCNKYWEYCEEGTPGMEYAEEESY